MQKQNMNWFATVLRVVICFIILTDLTEFSVEFCVDEVFEDRGGLDVRRRMRGKSSSLGYNQSFCFCTAHRKVLFGECSFA